MSFLAKIFVDDSEWRLLHVDFRLSQMTDSQGKPSSVPSGGSIALTLESTNENDLFEWMIQPTMTKSGKIVFYKRDNMSALKTLEFKDAACVEYHEFFQHNTETPMQIKLTLSARELKLNSSQFKNNWPK